MSKMLNQPLHILIDGPDKLGKTTIIERLSRQLNLPVVKMPDAKKYVAAGNIEEFSKFYNEIIVQFQEFDFIMDRGYPSSVAYSEVFNRDSESVAYTKDIEQQLRPKVFILTGERPFAEDDIPEHAVRFKDLKYVYEHLANRRGYELIDVTDKSPTEICNQIIVSLLSAGALPA